MSKLIGSSCNIYFKNNNGEGERLRNEFYSGNLHPYMFWKACRMSERMGLCGIPFIVTSVWRPDSIPHREWRGVDARTVDPVSGIVIVTPELYKKLRIYHNKEVRRFGTYDSFYRHIARGEDGKSRGDHIHTQCPKNVTIKLEA